MTVTEFSEKVEEYILKDRQWKREYRINHAKRQLDQLIMAKNRGIKGLVWDENFWRAVLQRIEHDEQDRFWRTKP